MNVAQRSFAGGEIAPALYARTDQVKYATGLRTCRNLIVQRHGGVANRPGTHYVATLADPTKPGRLVRFVFNREETYVLAMSERLVRFFTDGAAVTVPSGLALPWATLTNYVAGDLVLHSLDTYYCQRSHTSAAETEPGLGALWGSEWHQLPTTELGTIYEIPTPYAAADLAEVNTVQSADVLTVVHPRFPPHHLKRAGHTRWTIAPVVFGPTIAAPTSVTVTGGVAGADTTYAVTALRAGSGEESMPTFTTATAKKPDATTPVVLSWPQVPSASSYLVYRATDGSTFGLIGTSAGTSLPAADSSWDTGSATASGSGTGGVTTTGQARNTLDLASGRAVDGRYTVSCEIEARVTAGSLDGTDRIRFAAEAYYSRDGEARVFAGTTEVLTDLGRKTASVTVVVPAQVPYESLVLDLVSDLTIYDPASSWTATVTGTAVVWKGTRTGLDDPGLVADYATSPPENRTSFAGTNEYPATTGYYQQRQLFASSASEVERVWASRIGAYTNFTRSTPLRDDDSLSFVLASREVSTVHHLVDLGQLLIFTLAGEWVVQGDAAGALTPSSINARLYSQNGAHPRFTPQIIDATALYVEARGNRVRDLRPDPIAGFQGNDLTIFAAHLFQGVTLVDWALQRVPNSVVWAVRSDGMLLGLTYIPEQALWGWHRHDTDGTVENVVAVSEGMEDALYLLVRRTVQGSDVRYLERMATRVVAEERDGCFMDSALTYDGRNETATTVTVAGGTSWGVGESLTLSSSEPIFDATTDVGHAIQATAADGTVVSWRLTAVASPVAATVESDRTVPADLRGKATLAWARAVDSLGGLEHLEGKAVSILADGVVVASPGNPAYPSYVVTAGRVSLPATAAVVHVGLPYLSDLETLDMDTPQGPSTKETSALVTSISLALEATRGVWAGARLPEASASDQTWGLTEYTARTSEPYGTPPRAVSATVRLPIAGTWTRTGRIAVRQVDPLPLTVLAVMPTGFLPLARTSGP